MKTANPFAISIVTVVYNGANALRRTIESVVPHLNESVKFIVIDGGSTDGTQDIIRSYTPHFAYWVSEPDKGIYHAMNKGWRAATEGSYVLYLGAGDKLFSLPSEAELFDQRGVQLPVVIGRCALGGQLQFESRWGNELRLRNTVHHQALMVCKSLAVDPPFDESLKVYADWDFNLRLFRRGVGATYIDSLSSYAEPGGVSWRHDLSEIRTVARRHGGPLIGQIAWLLNWVSLRRRDSLERSSRAIR